MTDPILTDTDEPLSRARSFTCWLGKQPLLPPVIGLCIGIAIDAHWPVPLWLVITVFILCGVAMSFARKHAGRRHLILMIAAMSLGVLTYNNNCRRLTDDHIARFVGNTPISARITGTVSAPPQVRASSSGLIDWYNELPSTRFMIDAHILHGNDGPIDVSGIVAISIKEPALSIDVGQQVTIHGTLYRPLPPRNPGERDWAAASRDQGIHVRMSCNNAEQITIAPVNESNSPSSTTSFINSWRRRVRSAMLEDTYPGDVPGAGLLSALVLGQRSQIDRELNDAFVRTGTAHYLSVSGTHVGMLVSAVWLAGMVFGLSTRHCATTALVVATGYYLLAEPRPAILRAVIMTDLLCIAILMRRSVRSLNWLFLAAMPLLLNPAQLFQAGFQLSFAIVLMLILLTPKVRHLGQRLLYKLLRWDDPLLQPEIQRRILPDKSLWRHVYRFGNCLGWATATSFTAWLAALPLCAFHFQQIAIWGWLNSLLLLPLVWLTLLLGLLKTVVSLLLPDAGMLLGLMLEGVTNALISIVTALSDLPCAVLPTPTISPWLALTALLLMALWSLTDVLRLRQRHMIATTFCFLLVVVGHVVPMQSRDTLTMHVMAVGKGAACLLSLPNDETVVCDLGCTPPRDIYNWTLRPLLAKERIYDIDTVIVSHPNLDHFSALPDLFADCSVDRFVTSPYFTPFAADSRTTQRFIDVVQRQKLSHQLATQGDRLIDSNNVKVDVLWPPKDDERMLNNANESSLVLRIDCYNKRILLCGDIEEAAQTALLRDDRDQLKADVLLLPHHGSVVSTTQEFIEAVSPQYCIRSDRQPNAETTNGLNDLIARDQLFNTADCGAVTVQLTPDALRVEPFSVDTPESQR